MGTQQQASNRGGCGDRGGSRQGGRIFGRPKMARKMGHKSDSTQDLQDQNLNTDWMGFKGSWWMFTILIFLGRYTLFLFGVDDASAWGVIHIAHVTFTFVLFHWIKGTPLESTWAVNPSQGRFDKLTWWEQLDAGVQWTGNKKFLASLVVFTYVMALRPIVLKENFVLALAHTTFMCFGIVPKLPQLYGRRLFGI